MVCLKRVRGNRCQASSAINLIHFEGGVDRACHQIKYQEKISRTVLNSVGFSNWEEDGVFTEMVKTG